jgi:hypothetical protein
MHEVYTKIVACKVQIGDLYVIQMSVTVYQNFAMIIEYKPIKCTICKLIFLFFYVLYKQKIYFQGDSFIYIYIYIYIYMLFFCRFVLCFKKTNLYIFTYISNGLVLTEVTAILDTYKI